MIPITEKEKGYIVDPLAEVIRDHGLETGILASWSLTRRMADQKAAMINHMAIEGLGGL